MSLKYFGAIIEWDNSGPVIVSFSIRNHLFSGNYIKQNDNNEVIQLFSSCSTQLSMKFQLITNLKLNFTLYFFSIAVLLVYMLL